MEFPVTIESQDAFDSLVKDRIKRAEAKAVEPFSDYDEIKAKAAEVDAVRTAADEATRAAVARAEAAEAVVQTHEAAKEVARVRSEVAKAKGVPEAALRGSTKEELEAHADELKPLLTGVSPVIPTQGATPTASAAVESDREFANFLTGHAVD